MTAWMLCLDKMAQVCDRKKPANDPLYPKTITAEEMSSVTACKTYRVLAILKQDAHTAWFPLVKIHSSKLRLQVYEHAFANSQKINNIKVIRRTCEALHAVGLITLEEDPNKNPYNRKWCKLIRKNKISGMAAIVEGSNELAALNMEFEHHGTSIHQWSACFGAGELALLRERKVIAS